ncbi:hypothetical protein ROZALSC1DRAFT_25807, partial [Rozella allomycis CSF55]
VLSVLYSIVVKIPMVFGDSCGALYDVTSNVTGKIILCVLYILLIITFIAPALKHIRTANSLSTNYLLDIIFSVTFRIVIAILGYLITVALSFAGVWGNLFIVEFTVQNYCAIVASTASFKHGESSTSKRDQTRSGQGSVIPQRADSTSKGAKGQVKNSSGHIKPVVKKSVIIELLIFYLMWDLTPLFMKRGLRSLTPISAQKRFMSAYNVTFDILSKELQEISNPKRAQSSRRFFKVGENSYSSGDVFIGISVPDLRKYIVAKIPRMIDVSVLHSLFQSSVHEHRLAAILCLVELFQKPSRYYEQFWACTDDYTFRMK